MTRDLILNGKPVRFRLDNSATGVTLTLDDAQHEYSVQELAPGRLVIRNREQAWPARVARERDRIWVWLAGRVYEFRQPSADHDNAGGAAEHRDDVRAPMPGTLVKLMVQPGDTVQEGQIVAVVEAMKMEHPLRAPRAGVVSAVAGTTGAVVDADAVVVSFAPEEAA